MYSSNVHVGDVTVEKMEMMKKDFNADFEKIFADEKLDVIMLLDFASNNLNSYPVYSSYDGFLERSDLSDELMIEYSDRINWLKSHGLWQLRPKIHKLLRERKERPHKSTSYDISDVMYDQLCLGDSDGDCQFDYKI